MPMATLHSLVQHLATVIAFVAAVAAYCLLVVL
jgi:hypothetical protein